MDFDRAMATLEQSSPVGAIAETFTHTLPAEASGRPALTSPDEATADHAITVDDAKIKADVYRGRNSVGPVSCVYQIRHLASGRVYIGSSANLGARWAGHRTALKSGKHIIPGLQVDWTRDGADLFVLEILEPVAEREQLLPCEQKHLDRARAADPELVYNMMCKVHRRKYGKRPDAETWRLIRFPEKLACRLERLASEARNAHVEGRIMLPSAFSDKVPMWFVVQAALDEVEARRARCARPRAKK